MCKNVLSIDHLYLKRGDFCLEDICLNIEKGEILAILGKTGSGKTLLLETAAGFCEPDGGKVLFHENCLRDIPLHHRNIGYVYQDYCLFPHMTAEENIAYGLRMRHKKAYQDKIQRIADLFEIADILDQYPGTLSGGEQQRVALARALITEPQMILLDEPFSALDPMTKEKMHKLLLRIRHEFSCAIVFVTHNFHEAEQLADRIGILMNGKLCGIVSKRELYTADWPMEIRQFLGGASYDKAGII